MFCCEKDGKPLPITFSNITLKPISLGKRNTGKKQREKTAEIMTPQPDFRFCLRYSQIQYFLASSILLDSTEWKEKVKNGKTNIVCWFSQGGIKFCASI